MKSVWNNSKKLFGKRRFSGGNFGVAAFFWGLSIADRSASDLASSGKYLYLSLLKFSWGTGESASPNRTRAGVAEGKCVGRIAVFFQRVSYVFLAAFNAPFGARQPCAGVSGKRCRAAAGFSSPAKLKMFLPKNASAMDSGTLDLASSTMAFICSFLNFLGYRRIG